MKIAILSGVVCGLFLSLQAARAGATDDEVYDELPHERARPTYRPLKPLAAEFASIPGKEDGPVATSTSGSLIPMGNPGAPSSQAASQPADAAPVDKMRKGELSMLGVAEFLNDANFAGVGIGYFNLDSVHYITATPMVDLSFFDKRLHLNFGAPINVTLFDPNNGGFAVPARKRIRTQDWDEWTDYFKIIRRVQWGRKEDRVFLRLGRVGATSIGHGGLMRRYNNNMLANSTRVGFEVDLNSDYGGGEAFISDVTLQSSRVVSALGFVKPLGWMKHYTPKSLSLGVVYAGDLGAPSALRRDGEGVVLTDRGGNPYFDRTMIHGLGASVEVKPLRIGDIVDLKTYFEFNQLLGYGNGVTVGVLGRFNLASIFAIRARLEYRNLGSQYIPSYFDTFYEIQKLQVTTFNPSTFAPTKLDFLRSLRYAGGRASNAYFELTLSLIDKIAISVAYEGGGDPLLQNFLLHAEFTWFTWLRFFATYHKRNFSSVSELFSFSQNDLLYAQARLAILPILFVNGRVMKSFVWDPSVDLGLGGMRNVLDYRIDLELGWQWGN
jgi:hypothetical protein